MSRVVASQSIAGLEALLGEPVLVGAVADGGLWDLLEEHTPALVIVGLADAAEVLDVVAELASVVVVGDADADAEERWLRAGALDYVAEPVHGSGARLRAGVRRAAELAGLRSDAGRLAGLARLALEPPARGAVFDRVRAELGALGLPLAWQAAVVHEGGWRLEPGLWPDADAWPDPPPRASLQPRASGRELVLPLGSESASAGVLRVTPRGGARSRCPGGPSGHRRVGWDVPLGARCAPAPEGGATGAGGGAPRAPGAADGAPGAGPTHRTWFAWVSRRADSGGGDDHR